MLPVPCNDVSTTAPIILRGPIEQLCKEAKEIGYDGLEIQLANPRQYDWNHIKTVCNDSGLELIAFATGRELGENGLCLLSDDASVRRASIDRLKEHIDCAQSVGCNVIVGSMRKNIPDWSQREKYWNYHRDAILELSDYAKGSGVRIWVENILSYISNFLNTMRQVQDFVADLGRDNVGVHLDTYSMNMEDNDICRFYTGTAPRTWNTCTSPTRPGCIPAAATWTSRLPHASAGRVGLQGIHHHGMRAGAYGVRVRQARL